MRPHEMQLPLHEASAPAASPQLQAGTAGDVRTIFSWEESGAARNPPAISGDPAEAALTETQFLKVRRQVFYLAIGLGVLVALEQVVKYVFDFAELESAIQQIKSVSKQHHTHHKYFPDPGSLLINGIPHVLCSIGVGLLVPLCGYLGAKHSNPNLMCCFCSGNMICAGLAGFSMVMYVVILFIVNTAAPQMEAWLQQCDPFICTAPARAKFTTNETVDCLIASTEGYHRLYPSVPHLPAHCPGPEFLDCTHANKETLQFARWQNFCTSMLSEGECVQAWHDVERHPDEMCIWSEDACVPSRKDILGISAGGVEPGRPLASTRMDGGVAEPPLPKDPTASCVVSTKDVMSFHGAVELVPRLVPKLVAVLTLRLFLAVPVLVLSCLGFQWGRELYDRLSSGYAHVMVPSLSLSELQAQPGQQAATHIPGHGAPAPYAVMVQPAGGSALPGI